MIYYKIDVLAELKKKGYTVYRLQKESLLGNSTITKLNGCKGKRADGEGALSMKNLNKICSLLHCQPGDILQFR